LKKERVFFFRGSALQVFGQAECKYKCGTRAENFAEGWGFGGKDSAKFRFAYHFNFLADISKKLQKNEYYVILLRVKDVL
jgi:hypothetical protein